MLPNGDLERLIAEKRREIEEEKLVLGLSTPSSAFELQETKNKELTKEENETTSKPSPEKKVKIECERDNRPQDKGATETEDVNEIPAALERYLRRYLGLPVMLKAGEYSPNNPLVRAQVAAPGDALVGIGEYERRRQALRQLRQTQYRQYLDEQAKKKREAKEQAEKERREREERERLRDEERERERQQIEKDTLEEQRRASVCYVNVPNGNGGLSKTNRDLITKVDTGVQVGISQPLSVAVQTDDIEFFQPTFRRTQAERELSPRTVCVAPNDNTSPNVRRRSYGDFDERTSTLLCSGPRSRLLSDLRHSYMPSILDADNIRARNQQAEKEAAERRQFYQQELRNQIREQQRIRDERRTREKMLEQAEMRRLEEQLRMLRGAQSGERHRGDLLNQQMKENATDYEKKRTALQKEIDIERTKLHHLPHTTKPTFLKKPPFSTNIPHNSIFNPNYDVDSYLRKNLNPKKDFSIVKTSDENLNIENSLRKDVKIDKPKYEPTYLKPDYKEPRDDTPIPVLRHSPIVSNMKSEENVSEGMKLLEDKWKVPAVQKNMLKNSISEGKNINILTQLGSIRRQLQLEQMRLDSMSKSD